MKRRLKRKTKRKELDTVSVPPLPNASQLRAWRITLLQNLDATANRDDDKVIDWAREVEDESKPAEYFADSGKTFPSVDRKLAAALSKVATGELGRRITQLQDQAMQNENRMVRGREILRLIFLYFATGKNAEVMFSLN
ncbi:MAG: DUF5377 domain-containing protein, partial [bacterium]|nr:DUF5377 domain-containing protein [bacterium]